eukprot:1996-Rhodomonas_salina.2
MHATTHPKTLEHCANRTTVPVCTPQILGSSILPAGAPPGAASVGGLPPDLLQNLATLLPCSIQVNGHSGRGQCTQCQSRFFVGKREQQLRLTKVMIDVAQPEDDL